MLGGEGNLAGLHHGLVDITWRLSPESNRGARICSPLHDHSATQPVVAARRSLLCRANEKPRVTPGLPRNLERETRLELATPTLARLCSTN